MDKGHILAEIQRTARANGGKPLGRARFFQETGIKDSDWSGRYWARWNDAVREAGFSPNKLTEAYEESELLDSIIGLIRELGRFPVVAEMRLKRRSDPGFPDDKVFFNRFGAKNQMVARVLSYCRSRAGFDDIIRVCESAPAPQEPLEEESVQPQEGFVYLLKSGRNYKIGKSNAFGRREYELAIQLPEKAKTVHVIKTDDPSGIEAYWHNRFAAKRMNGEWFELDSSDVKAFRRRKFQ
jgi:hypothetical protein